jgi:hypothetical protein
MKEPNICPICKKDFGSSAKAKTKLKMHITRKDEPYHQLIAKHKRKYPLAPYFICMMELKPQLEALKAKYGPTKHFTEETVIHEEDPFLELEE